MDKEKKNLSRVIAGVSGLVLALCLLLSNSFSYSDPDLGWHIRVGRDIMSSGAAPSDNYYNFTLQGEWIDHEWLLNAVMAGLESFGGFDAMHIFFAFVALAALALVFWQGYKEGGAIVAAFLILFIFWASRPHLGIRVQEFGLLFTVILIYALSRLRPKVIIILIPILFIIWVNTHGSFLLGLALLAAYSIYLWTLPIIKPVMEKIGLATRESTNIERWLISLSWLLSVLATFVNPYGYRLYSLLAGYADTTYMGYIREWLGQYTLPLYYPQLIYLAFAAALIVFHLTSWRTAKKSTLWEYGLFVLFYILAWRSRRHFPLFAFISLPLISSIIKDMMADMRDMKEEWKKAMRSIFIIASLIVSTILLSRVPFGQDQVYAACESKYPCQALSELSKRGYEGRRVLNEFNWGGFLLYSAPELDIFIDGRMPQEPYGDWTILEEYRSIRYGLADIEEGLDRHGVDTVFIYTKSQAYRYRAWEKAFFNINDEDVTAQDPLRNYLETSADWRKVYMDDLASIYEKTSQ